MYDNVVNDNAEVKELDVKEVFPNPDQPRKAFDETALKELSESIVKHGVIQPITVVKRNDGYMIVAGERRFRASVMAGRKTVPAIVRSFGEREIKEIALLENLQREDLNPIEEARAIKRLMDEFALTQDEVAERLGKSRSAVANTLRLLSLSPEAHKAGAQRRTVRRACAHAGHVAVRKAIRPCPQSGERGVERPRP